MKCKKCGETLNLCTIAYEHRICYTYECRSCRTRQPGNIVCFLLDHYAFTSFDRKILRGEQITWEEHVRKYIREDSI